MKDTINQLYLVETKIFRWNSSLRSYCIFFNNKSYSFGNILGTGSAELSQYAWLCFNPFFHTFCHSLKRRHFTLKQVWHWSYEARGKISFGLHDITFVCGPKDMSWKDKFNFTKNINKRGLSWAKLSQSWGLN